MKKDITNQLEKIVFKQNKSAAAAVDSDEDSDN